MESALPNPQKKTFVKNKEDFTCEHCGNEVKGNGYTNHCPKCLWSKHVDVNPGDRQARCGGMMKPVGLKGKTNHYQIMYLCETCGFRRNNKVEKEDDTDVVIALSKIVVK